AAERGAGGVNRIDQVSASGDDSTNQVGVSAEILGARVHDQVNAKLRGPAIDGRGKRAVDQRGDPVLLRYSRNLLQIDDAQRWIGRRLKMENLGVGSDRFG